MDECVLIYDFGTSYFKAAIVSRAFEILASARVPTPSTRAADRCELPASAFVETAFDLARQVSSQRPQRLADVSAVSFSSQANTFVLVDSHDAPLTPFIVWTDERARNDCADVLSLAGATDYVQRSGIPALSHQFSISKLAWFARHESALFRQAATVHFLGDYFAHHLTSSHTMDGSIAGLTGLFDVIDWRWEPHWCDRAGIDVGLLPKVVRAGQSVGTIDPVYARRLGVRDDCQFVMGLLDQYAGAIGVGNDTPGGTSETTGTVLATVRCSTSFNAPLDAQVFRGPSPWPNRFFHMVFSEVAGTLFETLREALPDSPSFLQLDRLVDGLSSSPLKLDHRTPADILRQQIREWAPCQPTAHIVVAIYRVVADALQDQSQQLSTGEPVESILCAGGGAAQRKLDPAQIPCARIPCNSTTM